MKYKRIPHQISGEALWAIKTMVLILLGLTITQPKSQEIQETGTEIAIVIGGGNIFREYPEPVKGMDRVQADYMGMLATVINGLALQSALENNSVPTRYRPSKLKLLLNLL